MKGDDKHEKIIQAAIKIFARKGFYNSKISEIAKEAQVADGTIYLYFKNKDDILINIFEKKMKEIIVKMENALESEKTPLDKLRRFIAIHLRLVEENRHLAEVIQIELRQSNKFMKEYVAVMFFEYLNIISSVIKEGQEAGIIRKEVMPGIAKRAIFGALDELSLAWVLSKSKKYTLEQTAQQMSELFLNGMAER